MRSFIYFIHLPPLACKSEEHSLFTNENPLVDYTHTSFIFTNATQNIFSKQMTTYLTKLGFLNPSLSKAEPAFLRFQMLSMRSPQPFLEEEVFPADPKSCHNLQSWGRGGRGVTGPRLPIWKPLRNCLGSVPVCWEPPQIHMLKPNSQYDGIRRWGFGDAWSMRVVPL